MLFEPHKLGTLEVKNRLVRSATYEGLAARDGTVTDALVKFYETLGKGGVGVIITGYMIVRPDGKGAFNCTGIFRDEQIDGLAKVAAAIKAEGSRAVFQINHAGGQTMKRVSGFKPRAPSRHRRDYLMMSKPKPFTVEEIQQVVSDYATAARRAKAAGADGVQIHCSHGYLLSEFLSPFFNARKDEYGGSDENRFRIVGEIIAAIRKEVGDEFLVLTKFNVDDGTPEKGMTPELAAAYAAKTAAAGVSGVEISAGSTMWAPFVMCRGEAPVEDFLPVFPWLFRGMVRRKLRKMKTPPFEEGYNAHAAPAVKAALGDVPLMVVGGFRSVEAMEKSLQSGQADFISLCRPLIRQPKLAASLAAGKGTEAKCISCNRCLAAVFNALPLRCYVKGLP